MKFALGLKSGKQKLLSKFGKFDITKDDEYDNILNNYTSSKKICGDTLKQFKVVIDHLHALSASLTLLNESLAQCYGTSDPITNTMAKVNAMIEEFDEKAVQGFEKDIQFECVDPLTQFFVEFDNAKETLRLRGSKKIEFDGKRDAVKKLTEAKKSPKDPTKLPKAKERLKLAKQEYNESNFAAKTQMAQLIDTKGETLDPILCGFGNGMLNFIKNTQATLGQYKSIVQTVNNGNLNRSKVHITKPLGMDSVDIEDSYQVEDDSEDNEVSAPPLSSGKSSEIPEEYNTDWYYLDDDVQQMGPFDFQTLSKMYKSKKISSETHVYGGDLADWQAVKTLPQLGSALKNFKA